MIGIKVPGMQKGKTRKEPGFQKGVVNCYGFIFFQELGDKIPLTESFANDSRIMIRQIKEEYS